MKKAISYALFGYNKERQTNCFDFNSYLRGLLLNIRCNRLLFPDWEIVVQTDQPTYNAFQQLFDNIGIVVNINPEEPLTKAMLWRIKPVFDYKKYSHVICRDLDSPPTYREAQAVQDWIESDKAAHAITDSISHGVPLLGGMIGFKPQNWPSFTGYNHWQDMFNGIDIDFTRKGADQDFLNKYVYPKYAQIESNSICQHYILGMPNTFLDGYKNYIPDIDVPNVSRELIESNDICGHIGAAGYWTGQMFRLLQKHQAMFKDLLEVEKNFPAIAYWTTDNTFEL